MSQNMKGSGMNQNIMNNNLNQIHKELNANLPVALYKYDQKSRSFSYLSRGINGVTGYEKSEFLSGKIQWDDIIDEEDFERIKEERKNALYRKDHYKLSYKIKSRKGELRWIFEHGYGIYDDMNQIIGTEGFIYDFTEQKNNQDLMYKKLVMYRLMSENSSDLAFLLYPDLRVRFVSDSIREILGFNTAEITDKPFLDMVLPQDKKVLNKEILNDALDGQEFRKVLYRSKTRKGKIIWLEAIIKPFRNLHNVIRGIHVVSRDVTLTIEREKKLENYAREIREKTMLMSSILDTMAEGVIVLDKDGQYKLVNKAAKKGSLLNKNGDFSEYSLQPPLFYDLETNRELEEEDLPAHRALKGESIDNFETYIKNINNDSGFYASMNARPLKDSEGNITGSIAVVRDINSSKQLQFALEKEKDKAEEAANIKSQFLSNMSHEIRTPLNGIVALINFLMENNPRKDQEEHLKLLKFSSDHLMSLINNILDLNKLEEGKLELEYQEWDLKKHLRNIIQMYEMKARDKNIRMDLDYDKKLSFTYKYDKVRLTQIISNLINNAIKFTDEGDVNLKVYEKGKPGDNILIRFEISDTGIGIEKEKIERIFERFSQADSSVAAKYGGSGLGLSISRKLLELMNSDLYLKSTPGQGSTFYFDLTLNPVSEIIMNEEKQGFKQETDQKNQFDILVVDDNHVNLLVAEKYLKGWGGKVDKASGGKDALKKVKANKYHLMLLDIQMPDIDGLEVTRRIRAAKNRPYRDIPIIALSAAVLKHQKDEAMEAGVDAYITKPFDPDDLRIMINRFVSGKLKEENTDEKSTEIKIKENNSWKENMVEAINFYSEGDEGFRNEFIGTLLSGLEEFNDLGIKYVKRSDLENFRKIHHKIKSNLKILKLVAINELSDKIKDVMRKEDSKDLDHFADELKALISKAIDILYDLKNNWTDSLKSIA